MREQIKPYLPTLAEKMHIPGTPPRLVAKIKIIRTNKEMDMAAADIVTKASHTATKIEYKSE